MSNKKLKTKRVSRVFVRKKEFDEDMYEKAHT